MKDLFDDVLNMDDVRGVLLVSYEGKLIYDQFLSPPAGDPRKKDWMPFIRDIKGVREADLVFSDARIYMRRTNVGYLIVLMGLFASSAMVRLNCDMLLPSLKNLKGKIEVGAKISEFKL